MVWTLVQACYETFDDEPRSQLHVGELGYEHRIKKTQCVLGGSQADRSNRCEGCKIENTGTDERDRVPDGIAKMTVAARPRDGEFTGSASRRFRGIGFRRQKWCNFQLWSIWM